jgi:hypothetical protein
LIKGETMLTKDIHLNQEQRLYAFTTEKSVQCLGFDYAFQQAEKVAKWLGLPPPNKANVGTVAGYAEYDVLMQAGAEHNRITGKRCLADLDPRLTPHLGKRVEVTYKDKTKERFIVGRSTGWFPTYIARKTTRSHGGAAVLSSLIVSIREI